MLSISASYGFALHLPLSATDSSPDDEPEFSLSAVMETLEMRCCCYCNGGVHVDDTDAGKED
jgi:hypothetical protein